MSKMNRKNNGDKGSKSCMTTGKYGIPMPVDAQTCWTNRGRKGKHDSAALKAYSSQRDIYAKKVADYEAKNKKTN